MRFDFELLYYIIVAFLLVVYFEITGKLFLSFINFKKTTLSFPFGLMVFLAIAYLTTSILTYMDCSFWIIFVIYFLYFVISIFLVIKFRKIINWKISTVDWLIVFALALLMLYCAYNTTLGDTSGFDSTFYLNLISTNIKAKNLNLYDVYFGGLSKTISVQYVFQSYYYFASCYTFVAVKLLSYVTEANNLSTIIWIFQTLFNFFFVSILINGANYVDKDKKYLKYVFIIMFVFFIGKLYWNNLFGFYGNSYRTIAISYSTLALCELIKNDTKQNWILFGICLLSSCSFSSSGVFTIIFLLFGAFFVLVKTHKSIFKWYALIAFIPLINLISVTIRTPLLVTCILTLVACCLIYLLNDKLVVFFNKKYVLTVFFIGSFLITFILSFMVTGDVFNFEAFFNNLSEKADMTINYFSPSNIVGGKREAVYKLIVLVLLMFSVLFERKNAFIKILMIVFIIFFSPFNCSIINKYNIVYYRALDIIVNPFTLTLFASLLFDKVNYSWFYYVSLTAILIFYGSFQKLTTPYYYHEMFIPEKGYNNIMKMKNDEFDVLNILKKEVEFSNEEKYIVTSNLLTECVIPNCRYIYGRAYIMNGEWTEAEKQVYTIFCPLNYLGEGCKDVDPDYDNVAKYIKEAGIDYIVMDKKLEYYNKNTDSWEYLIYTIAECGYGYSIYSNDSYELFCFD